ncbi:hypothetical protein ACJX0J_013016 [Zea mays]
MEGELGISIALNKLIRFCIFCTGMPKKHSVNNLALYHRAGSRIGEFNIHLIKYLLFITHLHTLKNIHDHAKYFSTIYSQLKLQDISHLHLLTTFLFKIIFVKVKLVELKNIKQTIYTDLVTYQGQQHFKPFPLISEIKFDYIN